MSNKKEEKKNKKAYSKQTLSIFWKQAMELKGLFFLMVASIVTISIMDIMTPIYMKNFLDSLSSGFSISTALGIIVIIAVLKGISWLLWRVSDFSIVHFESFSMSRLMDKCFAYLHKHSSGFFADNFSGALVKRIRSFSRAFEAIMDNLIYEVVPMVVTIVSAIIVLWKVNYIISVVILVWIVFYMFISIAFSRFKLKYDLELSSQESETSGVLADTVSNYATIKLFNGYERETGLFARMNESVRKLRKTSWGLGSAFNGLQALLFTVLEVGLLVYAVKLYSAGNFSIGSFVLLQSYISLIFHRIWSFYRVIRNYYENIAEANEMTEILLTPHEIRDAKGAKNLVVDKGSIAFKNVGFKYKNGADVINDLSFEIKPKERVAFIGPSGAGKSTIVKLILRSFNVSSGEIDIDGQNINEVTQESLWKNVAYVPQDPSLFHRSLMDNIRYGMPEATDEQVLEAARLAHCHEFISGFTEGYETKVGERGVKLSGGERQRVAIARAILKDAPILILDEATSALDSESEVLIQEALENLMKKKTVIIIAHRLSTIKKMDRIIAIKEGGIAEEGTHKELMEFGGLYKSLYEIQSEGFAV